MGADAHFPILSIKVATRSQSGEEKVECACANMPHDSRTARAVQALPHCHYISQVPRQSAMCCYRQFTSFDREAYAAMLEGQEGGGAVGRDRTLPALILKA